MRVLNFLFRHIYGRINPLKYAQKIGVTIGERCRIIGSPKLGKRTLSYRNRKSYRNFFRLYVYYS